MKLNICSRRGNSGAILRIKCKTDSSLLFRHVGTFSSVCPFNPFMPNGIYHHYQLDESISGLRDVGWYFVFIFIQILKETSVSKQR